MSNATPSVRVLIVDDHPVVRAGIRAMLSSEGDIDVVGEADSAEAALDAVQRLSPSVVLMDLRMPGGGVEATATLQKQAPAVKVVVLTTYGSDAEIVRAIEAGATGYLLKGVDREDMLHALRAAHRGETVMGTDAMAALTRSLRRPKARVLSERERQVLALIATGSSNAEVASAMHIEEATVKTYLLRIYDKLGTRGRTAAVITAVTDGLIDLPGRRPDPS